MIFLILGSQKFQFNRLLKKLDELIVQGIITDEVIAQKGYSDYQSKNFKSFDFLDKNQFDYFIDKSDILIVHGGTGSIINGVKKRKKVIAVPRLKRYGEHVDDHQLDIVKTFSKMNFVLACFDLEMLAEQVSRVTQQKLSSYQSNNTRINHLLIDFIEKRVNKK